ncbi:MAG TPA: hypothetical protein VF168_14215 [Trueperaceae bacterium]
MSDVSKLGPLGEGAESRPLKVDLTRIDIRRGTLNLPRRFYDAFPAGEIEANDVALGRKLTVTFVPPRELEGLGPFFEEHDLQPNDAVTIAVAGGLQLTPIKRERRQERGDAQEAVARSEPVARGSAANWSQSGQQGAEGGYVRERVRLETPQLGREPRGDGMREKRGDDRGEQSRVRLEAQEPAAYLAPPVPETKGGWQDVLHDPVPRRGQMLRPSERAVVRPDDLPDGGVREKLERSDMRQQTLFGGEPEHYGTVREAPRQEARPGRHAPESSRPLAPRQEAEDEQPRNRSESNRSDRDVGGVRGREAQKRPAPASGQGRAPAPEPQLAEEREPVLVGGAQAEGDVTGRIASYLQNPSTPAIVRAYAVAEELHLPIAAVQKALAEVSRNSDGSVAPIREDVYLVKRGR